MIEKFRKATNEEAGDNWLICWTGSDAQGNGFNVTTDHVHASELHEYTRGAEGDANLIARLLNWYYSDPNAAEQCLHMDDGDAPASQALSHPEVLLIVQADSKPAHRQ